MKCICDNFLLEVFPCSSGNCSHIFHTSFSISRQLSRQPLSNYITIHKVLIFINIHIQNYAHDVFLRYLYYDNRFSHYNFLVTSAIFRRI